MMSATETRRFRQRHSSQVVLALSLTCCCIASAVEAAPTVHNDPLLPGDGISEEFRLTVDGVNVPCINHGKGGDSLSEYDYVLKRFTGKEIFSSQDFAKFSGAVSGSVGRNLRSPSRRQCQASAIF